MEESFNPVSQLTTLLGPKPNHPWGALIPQVLLWCFRRFCILKLSEPYEAPLAEQVWDDHLDLIHLYAPSGLESAASAWLTPENVDHVHSSLEEYNRFFIESLVAIDTAMTKPDSDMESMMSEFLDINIKGIIRTWLVGEYTPFLIFPMKDEDDDEFTDEQFSTLITSLTSYVSTSYVSTSYVSTSYASVDNGIIFIADRNISKPSLMPRGSTARMKCGGSYWGKTRRIRAVV
jgi:hypothetical protein